MLIGDNGRTAAEYLRPRQQWVRVVRHADVAPAASSSPGETADLAALLSQLRSEQIALRSVLRDHGGLLLRGWPVDTPAGFETLAHCFLAEQASYIGGVSRRSRVHNNVYNTTEAPSDVVIEQHLEATHTPCPPELILFNCQIAHCRNLQNKVKVRSA